MGGGMIRKGCEADGRALFIALNYPVHKVFLTAMVG